MGGNGAYICTRRTVRAQYSLSPACRIREVSYRQVRGARLRFDRPSIHGQQARCMMTILHAHIPPAWSKARGVSMQAGGGNDGSNRNHPGRKHPTREATQAVTRGDGKDRGDKKMPETAKLFSCHMTTNQSGVEHLFLQRHSQEVANFAQWSGNPTVVGTRQQPPFISFITLEAPKANYSQEADNLWPFALETKCVASFDSRGAPAPSQQYFARNLGGTFPTSSHVG